MNNDMTYARLLLSIYDRKLMNGETSFARSGIEKGDFTAMCTNPKYVITRERTEHICECMNITGEEKEQLLEFCYKAGK